MLDDYDSYMGQQPNSLITRFYGCHAITMYGTTLYFAVMQVRRTGRPSRAPAAPAPL